MNYRRNYSGCYDPTAGVALEHIVRDECRKRKRERMQEQTSQTEQRVTQKSKRQRYVITACIRCCKAGHSIQRWTPA